MYRHIVHRIHKSILKAFMHTPPWVKACAGRCKADAVVCVAVTLSPIPDIIKIIH